MKLSQLLIEYRPGSGDWDWSTEFMLCRNDIQMNKLVSDIKENGIRLPILLGSDGRVWDGHHRLTAAEILGLDNVPALTADAFGEEFWEEIEKKFGAKVFEADQ